MPTLEASGTQAATPGTEHTLSTLTVSKTLFPVVDGSALVAGEYLELKSKTKVLAAGATVREKSVIFSWLDAAIDPAFTLPPLISDQEYVLTLKQIGGSSRSFPWKILSP